MDFLDTVVKFAGEWTFVAAGVALSTIVFGFVTLVRMRGRSQPATIATRNGLECRPPDQFSTEDRGRFLLLVKEGGEADVTLQRILNAKCLAFSWVSGEVGGVAAIKRPNDGYVKKIERKTGSKLPKANWPFELGYVYVRPRFQRQGHATSLVRATLEHVGSTNVFATTRVDNDGMIRLLQAFGFVRSGREYLSDDKVRTLSLWLRGKQN